MRTILLNALMAIMLFLMPYVNFGQAPPLGAASSFALFTAVGAFNNTGSTTTVTGDVGTDIGAFNAFPPGVVIGTIYYETNPFSAVVAADVQTAYNNLAAVTCDFTIGVELGNQTLTPGVYCTVAASTLNGDLTLDGQGNPNALFIFKIGGALTTGASSNVMLSNSASSNNVYWRIDGAVDLGVSSVFRGTMLVNGAISLLDGASLFGRGLSRAGAIDLTTNNMVDVGMPPLPVTLVSFNAQKCDAKTCVNLSWQTASEFNSAYFLIERSTDGITFKNIGERDAVGYSTRLLSYFFTDENPAQGINYYRLNQFDINGMHEYSPTKAVRFSNTILVVGIYPNPVKYHEVYIDMSQLKSTEAVRISCSDMQGRILLNEIFDYSPLILLHLPKNYAGAFYFLTIKQGELIHNTCLMQLP